MAQRSSLRSRHGFIAGALALVSLLAAQGARADFARPPESPYERVERDPEPERQVAYGEEGDSSQASTFRFHVGPAVLIEPASPGLLTALDMGRGAVGARISASFLRPETEKGFSSYTAELWIDFRHRYELHPILGAGASVLRGGALQHGTAGAGVLRGALEYELPISDADARIGLNLIGLVPALANDSDNDNETERTRPWVEAALMIGAGF